MANEIEVPLDGSTCSEPARIIVTTTVTTTVTTKRIEGGVPVSEALRKPSSEPKSELTSDQTLRTFFLYLRCGYSYSWSRKLHPKARDFCTYAMVKAETEKCARQLMQCTKEWDPDFYPELVWVDEMLSHCEDLGTKQVSVPYSLISVNKPDVIFIAEKKFDEEEDSVCMTLWDESLRG